MRHEMDDELHPEHKGDGLDDLREEVGKMIRSMLTPAELPVEDTVDAIRMVKTSGKSLLPREEVAELSFLLGLVCPQHLFEFGVIYGILLERYRVAKEGGDKMEVDQIMDEVQSLMDELNKPKKDGE